MKIAVTGGLGVNGVWLVRALLDQGEQILVIDVEDHRILPLDLVDKIIYASVDVGDYSALFDILKSFKPDAIAHLAAMILANDNPHAAFKVNISGTSNIFEVARILGIPRVVYTSSRAVFAPTAGRYGPPEYRPLPATYPRACWPGLLRVYSMTKIACEDLGWHYADHFGLDFTALRFAGIYGPGKLRRHGNVALHSKIIDSALRGEAVTVEDGHNDVDDIMYVKDVARAIGLAIHSKVRLAPAYNIGSGRGSSLSEFVAAVRAAVPQANIEIGGGKNPFVMDGRCCVMDIGPAERDLGYRPKYDLERGVADCVEEMRAALSN